MDETQMYLRMTAWSSKPSTTSFKVCLPLCVVRLSRRIVLTRRNFTEADNIDLVEDNVSNVVGGARPRMSLAFSLSLGAEVQPEGAPKNEASKFKVHFGHVFASVNSSIE
jgi:hypothetical protein